MAYRRSLIPTIGSVQDARNVPAKVWKRSGAIFAQGENMPGSAGSAKLRWNADDTRADNGGTVLIPTGYVGTGRINVIYDGAISLRWFGAKINGLTDDSVAATAAFQTTANILPWSGVLRITETLYRSNQQNIQGFSSNQSVIFCDSGSDGLVSENESAQYNENILSGFWLTKIATLPPITGTITSGSPIVTGFENADLVPINAQISALVSLRGTTIAADPVVTGISSTADIAVGYLVSYANLIISGTITIGSNVITEMDTVAGVISGMRIDAAGIPVGTTVTGIGTDTITMSANATGATDEDISFTPLSAGTAVIGLTSTTATLSPAPLVAGSYVFDYNGLPGTAKVQSSTATTLSLWNGTIPVNALGTGIVPLTLKITSAGVGTGTLFRAAMERGSIFSDIKTTNGDIGMMLKPVGRSSFPYHNDFHNPISFSNTTSAFVTDVDNSGVGATGPGKPNVLRIFGGDLRGGSKVVDLRAGDGTQFYGTDIQGATKGTGYWIHIHPGVASTHLNVRCENGGGIQLNEGHGLLDEGLYTSLDPQSTFAKGSVVLNYKSGLSTTNGVIAPGQSYFRSYYASKLTMEGMSRNEKSLVAGWTGFGTRENLIVRSCNFPNGAWVQTGSISTNGNYPPPYGGFAGTSAQTIITTSGTAFILNASSVAAASQTVCFSCWVKTISASAGPITMEVRCDNEAYTDTLQANDQWQRVYMSATFSSGATGNIQAGFKCAVVVNVTTFAAYQAQLNYGYEPKVPTLTVASAVSPATITATGATLTSGNAVVTNLSSTVGLTEGQYVVTGTGVAQFSNILTVDSGTQITMTRNASASGSNITLTFTPIPVQIAQAGGPFVSDYGTVTIHTNSGSLGRASTQGTSVTISAESGTTDDLDYLDGLIAGVSYPITIRATSGHTITLKNGTGNFSIGGDIALTGSTLLLWNGTAIVKPQY